MATPWPTKWPVPLVGFRNPGVEWQPARYHQLARGGAASRRAEHSSSRRVADPPTTSGAEVWDVEARIRWLLEASTRALSAGVLDG